MSNSETIHRSSAVTETSRVGPKMMLKIAVWRQLPDLAYEALVQIDYALFPFVDSPIRELRHDPLFVNEAVSSIDSAMQMALDGTRISYTFPLSDNRSRILLEARRKRKRLRVYLSDATEEVRDKWEHLS